MIPSCGTSAAHPLRVCCAYVAHQRRLLQLGPPNTTRNCLAAAKVPSERASWQCGLEAVRRCRAGARSAVQRRQQRKAAKRCTLRYQSSRFHAPPQGGSGCSAEAARPTAAVCCLSAAAERSCPPSCMPSVAASASSHLMSAQRRLLSSMSSVR